MPEPTDHRAEDWTQDAKIHFIQAAERNDDGDLVGFDPELMRGAQVAALIGIDHYLGAIHEALLALGTPQQPSLVTLDSEAVVTEDQAALIRSILAGQYRVTPPNPADIGGTTWHGNQMHRFSVPLPVSPSEG